MYHMTYSVLWNTYKLQALVDAVHSLFYTLTSVLHLYSVQYSVKVPGTTVTGRLCVREKTHVTFEEGCTGDRGAFAVCKRERDAG